METILYQQAPADVLTKENKTSVISRFMNWCEGQEKFRFGWLAAVLAIHGCALTPITLFAIILAGTNIVFFISALVAMGLALVTNLAAMPTKITIPVFFLSIAIDIAIIISCVVVGFDITGTYV